MSDSEPHPAEVVSGGVRGALQGATYPVRGLLFLLRQPSTWGRAAVPAVVNGLLLLVCVVLALALVDELREWIVPDRWETADWKGTVVGILSWVVAVLLALGAAIVTALATASILAGPFSEMLSEKVEILYLGTEVEDDDEPIDWVAFFLGFLRGMWTTFLRLLIFGLIYVPLLLLTLIPVLGLAAAAAVATYSAFFLALAFSDPTLDRKGLRLGGKLRWARSHLAPWLGFGFACLAAMLIPIVDLLIAPALVAGGTLLFLDSGGDSELPVP